MKDGTYYIHWIDYMFNGSNARPFHQPLGHGSRTHDVLVDGAFEPGYLERCLRGVLVPEHSHLFPLGGVAAVAFCDDDLLDFETVEGIWSLGH